MNRLTPQYALLGNGRVARHLSHYFQLLNIPFLHWHRAQARHALDTIIEQSTHIIIAIADHSIETFARTLKPYHNKIFIHCSGALSTDLAHGAHPLQTFSSALYTLDVYRSTPFIIEKDGPTFETLLPGLPNPSFSISRSQKAYYHALCVMANNFTTLLWQKAFHEFEQTLGIDRSALFSILMQTCSQLKNHSHDALTGPLTRNDTQTIQRHLNVLAEDSFYDVYQAFLTATKNHVCP